MARWGGARELRGVGTLRGGALRGALRGWARCVARCLQDGPEFNQVSEEAKDLIKGLMSSKAEKRLTATQSLKHPWLTLASSDLSTAQLPAAQSKLKDYAGKMKLPVQKFYPGEFIIRQARAPHGPGADLGRI